MGALAFPDHLYAITIALAFGRRRRFAPALKSKLHLFDLSLICCTTSRTTNPQNLVKSKQRSLAVSGNVVRVRILMRATR